MRNMKLKTCPAALLWVTATSVAAAQSLHPRGAPCDVTAPNGIVAGSSRPQAESYGNRLLSVGPFGLWPDGTVVFKPGGAGFITSDGALGMKFGWTRGAAGRLAIAGRRLDAQGPPLRAHIPDGYGDTGFQASYVIFPSPGCWEVTARIGGRADSMLTFVTRVVKIGAGPAGRLDPSSR